MSKHETEVHFIGQIAQKALIEQDGKILLVQYPLDDDPAAGMWDLPGGRLNVDETPIEGLKREVREELGVEIDVHEIITTGAHVISDTYKLYIVLHRATLSDPSAPLIPEEGEIGSIEWRDKQDILSLPMVNTVYKEALIAQLF